MTVSNSRRRDSDEIAYTILRSATENDRKTRIMYRARLNIRQLNHYLTLLIDRGMIEVHQKRRYGLTERGKKFIVAYERCSETRSHLAEQELALADFWTRDARRTAQFAEPLSIR